MIDIIVGHRANNNLEFSTVVTKNTIIVIEISFDTHVSGDPGLCAIIPALLMFLNVSLLYNSHRTVPLLCYNAFVRSRPRSLSLPSCCVWINIRALRNTTVGAINCVGMLNSNEHNATYHRLASQGVHFGHKELVHDEYNTTTLSN